MFLQFNQKRKVKQIRDFDLLSDRDMRELNVMMSNPDVEIVHTMDKDIKGVPGSEFHEGFEPQLIRIVTYLIDEDKIGKERKDVKKESEENQEDKLVHETIELDALNSEFQLKITLPRQTSLLYNFQSYRGIITPPPEII